MPRKTGRKNYPLYDPAFERGACGTGFVATLTRRPSHEILRLGLQSVIHLAHRGALSADEKTGDGAGILAQIPWKFFSRALQTAGHAVPPAGDLAVGMIFLPSRNFSAQERCRVIVEEILGRRGLAFLGWRAVPTDRSAIGEKARSRCPHI